MKLLFLLASALAFTPALLATQDAQRKVAEPNPRAELPRTVRLIDLHDILITEAAYPDFEPPAEDVEPGDERATEIAHRPQTRAPAPVSPEVEEARRVAKRAVQWQAMLRLWMQPPLDAERDRLEMLSNGTLLANLTPDAHAWLDEFVALQRDQHFMFGTQFQIVIGPKEVIRRILPSGKDQVFLSEAESERMLSQAKEESKSDVILAPKFVSFFRTRCSISTYDKIAYIKDWTVETVEPGHQQIADPHVSTVRDGFGILVRGVALAGDRIGLEIVIGM